MLRSFTKSRNFKKKTRRSLDIIEKMKKNGFWLNLYGILPSLSPSAPLSLFARLNVSLHFSHYHSFFFFKDYFLGGIFAFIGQWVVRRQTGDKGKERLV